MGKSGKISTVDSKSSNLIADANGTGRNDHQFPTHSGTPGEPSNSASSRIFSSPEHDQCKLYRCADCGKVFCIVCDVPEPSVRPVLISWGVTCPMCLEFSSSNLHRVSCYAHEVGRNGK